MTTQLQLALARREAEVAAAAAGQPILTGSRFNSSL